MGSRPCSCKPASTRHVEAAKFRKGELICREGDYGSSAFFIERGSVDIFLRTPLEHVENQPRSGFWAAIGRFTTKMTTRPGDHAREYIPVDALRYIAPRPATQATMGTTRDISGEMTRTQATTCRSATVTAAEDCTVLEMLRNVLYIMQRSPSFRRELEAKYRARTIDGHLRSVSLFAPLRATGNGSVGSWAVCARGFAARRCEPGEAFICRQGSPAAMTALPGAGRLVESVCQAGGLAVSMVLNYVGLGGGYSGEVGVLSELAELRDLAAGVPCTAACTARSTHVDPGARSPRPTSAPILGQAAAVTLAVVVAEARKRLPRQMSENVLSEP